jgi:probable phosphoglycerate mutase
VRAPLQVDERLRELDPGEADGLTWDEYTDRYGEFDLVAEPDRPFAPGGDSHHTFVTRLTETFGEFANAYAGRTVVAVAHGGTVLVSMLALIGAPSIPGGDIAKPAHASITEWTHGDRWVLERYNDTAHLE